MNYEDNFLSKCPHCDRKKWLPIPYNIDFFNNIVWTICGKCKQKYQITFMLLDEPVQCYYSLVYTEQTQKGIYEREWKAYNVDRYGKHLEQKQRIQLETTRLETIRNNKVQEEEVYDLLTPI